MRVYVLYIYISHYFVSFPLLAIIRCVCVCVYCVYMFLIFNYTRAERYLRNRVVPLLLFFFFFGMGLVSPTVSFITARKEKSSRENNVDRSRARSILQLLFIIIITFFPHIIIYLFIFFSPFKNDYPALQ